MTPIPTPEETVDREVGKILGEPNVTHTFYDAYRSAAVSREERLREIAKICERATPFIWIKDILRLAQGKPE